ncbi:unnamed protein product [Phytomonas sp. Hart1]|nr:unnamed protein product [Phytomonas sp. Hart1]|eukprot:CCW66084.1 unnamed protein product [Phytomonas sp. isolate Hart1]
MPPPRPCVRCVLGKGRSDGVKDVLSCRSFGENPHKGARARSPLGRPRTRERARGLDGTQQARFLEAVSSHVHQRAGGIAGFYVLLARGAIGEGLHPRIPTKASSSDTEERPKGPMLTLNRCWQQLVSLISIPVSMVELADLLWDPKYFTSLSAEELASLEISFKDFAEAFGTNLFGKHFLAKRI